MGRIGRPGACLGVLCMLLLGCADKSSPTKSADIPLTAEYDTTVAGLPDAEPTQVVEVRDGDSLRLTVGYVAKEINGRKVRMLAYNRSVPGPTLKVAQGARITILLKNGTGIPTTLHSHGVRLDYQYDGVPGVSGTMAVVDSGQTLAYKINFPDPGIYWYHPHERADYATAIGLYGSYLVTPTDSAYWPPVNREVVLMLGDILLDSNAAHPFYRNITDYALMGRFGNVLMINGDPNFTLHVKRNEAIRFYTVNASNARVYNLQFSRDMDMNIIGADNGRYEFPTARENYMVAPSERLIFQLYFNDGLDDYDTLELLNVTPVGTSVLGKIIYDPDTIKTDYRSSLALVRSPQAAASIDPFRASFDKLPDEEILLTGYMDMSGLMKTAAVQHDPDPSNTMGVEWNDSVHGPAMVMMNQESTDRNMHWAIRDLKTGKENHDIHWLFKRGSQVLIRVRNDTTTAGGGGNRMYHPMPHPLHFHGQRFLVVRENGKVPLEGLVWRDSYLIGRGYTVDLLLDASNPGDWMFHCHIAEHFESDMMGHFSVVDVVAGRQPFAWSLSLNARTAYDSLRRDTTLVLSLSGNITGKVNGFDAAILEGSLLIQNADDADAKISVPLHADGSFSLKVSDLPGPATGKIAEKVFVRPKTAGYRPSPDTLRLTLDRRPDQAWSLDLDLAGGVSFKALTHDTAAVSAMQGEVSGKVNGFDPEAEVDSLYFRNMIYPELFANVPLDSGGAFRFDAVDIVGHLDGLHSLRIFLKPKTAEIRLTPDTLHIDVSIP